MADNTESTEDETTVPILSRLRAPAGAIRKRKRKGRGPGSGLGKTAGRGQKGQKARKPGNIKKLHFEGGQMPLQRRIPKRGFKNIHAKTVVSVNVRDLAVFDAGSIVTVESMIARGLIRGRFDLVKVLGDGEIDRSLTIHAHAVSAGALAKIQAAGGSVELLATTPAVEGAPASE